MFPDKLRVVKDSTHVEDVNQTNTNQETSYQDTTKNEKKVRRLWKSFSVESTSNGTSDSSPLTPGIDDVQDLHHGIGGKKNYDVQHFSSKKFGAVLPDLKYQLAEQGDKEAQMDLARELLINVNSDALTEDEVQDYEERAMFWLLRAAEQGHQEAVDAIKVTR